MANVVDVSFNESHEGILKANDNETNLSYYGKGFSPYELFLGGYASCLHATFLGIINKRRITITNASYNVEGFKRDETPTVLNKLITNVIIEGALEEHQEKIIKSMKLAEKYCSISETINKLDAEMILNVTFK